MNRTWSSVASSLVAVSVIVILLVDLSMGPQQSFAKKGGGKPPKDPPPPPPVLYELTWLGTLGGGESLGNGMNNFGEIVGRSTDSQEIQRAYIWTDPTTGGMGMQELQLLIPNAVWVDLDENGNPSPADPTQWRLTEAQGINDAGQISGFARHNTQGDWRAFRLDPGDPNDPINNPDTVLLLPYEGLVNTDCRINAAGEVAYNGRDAGGVDHVFIYSDLLGLIDVPAPGHVKGFNDNGQLVGTWGVALGFGCYRFSNAYDPGDLEFFADLVVENVNSLGDFVGKDDTGFKAKPFRYIDQVETLTLKKNDSGWAFGINDSADVTGLLGNRGFVFRDEDGVVKLDDLITGDPADVDEWLSAYRTVPQEIRNRDATTQFGAITGNAIIELGVLNEAFLLVPILNPAAP